MQTDDSPDWPPISLTARQAYLAMFRFLERHYEATRADDVGALLGGLRLLPDGGSADPAYQFEWAAAARAASAEGEATAGSREPVARPGQLGPTALEAALLDRLAADHPDAGLPRPGDARMVSRTFTGVGSFTEFLAEGRPKTAGRRVIDTRALVTVPGLRHGLGVVAFLEGDRLTLETFTYDEKWDGATDGFVVGTTPAPGEGKGETEGV